MTEFFGNFFDWMQALSPVWAYLTLLIIAYGENVLPPVPGDLVVVFGGYLAGLGQLSFWAVVGLSTLGGALGFMTMYAVGRRIGDAVLDPDRLRWLPKEGIGKAQRWLLKWGYGVVAANRFLSGARSVISLTVGMAHMHAARTLLWSTVSAFVWTLLITWGGYAVGENWEVIGAYLKTYGRFMLGALLLVAIVLLVRWWRQRSRAVDSGGSTS